MSRRVARPLGRQPKPATADETAGRQAGYRCSLLKRRNAGHRLTRGAATERAVGKPVATDAAAGFHVAYFAARIPAQNRKRALAILKFYVGLGEALGTGGELLSSLTPRFYTGGPRLQRFNVWHGPSVQDRGNRSGERRLLGG